jgi:spore maturation protein SpmB
MSSLKRRWKSSHLLDYHDLSGFSGISVRVNVYESFIDGAKDGFNVAIKIVPYLIAILGCNCRLQSFRIARCTCLTGSKSFVVYLGVTATEWVDALPVAFMKPLEWKRRSAAHLWRVIEQFDVSSLASSELQPRCRVQQKLRSTFWPFTSVLLALKRRAMPLPQGYLLIYFGIIAAIIVGYLFFGNA